MHIGSDDESQNHLNYEDSDCDESYCYSDNSAICYEEIDGSSHSGESEVPNDLEDWLKFTLCGNTESKAAF